MVAQSLTNMMSIATLALCAFGVLFCLSQSRSTWVFRAFGLVLLARGAMEVGNVSWPITSPIVAAHFDILTEAIWLICWVSIAPLFWHYVWSLTAVTPRLPEQFWVHLVLPAIGLVLCGLLYLMPQAARFGLFVDAYPVPNGWPFAVGVMGEILILVAIVQWAAYFAAIIQRLLAYRTRLREYVASTARRELTWIWVLIGLLVVYWTITAIEVLPDFVSQGLDVPAWVEDLLGLVLLIVILLGGLRQRPALAPEIRTLDVSQKYEKSALTSEMAERLERKLRLAMTANTLHHDANLSLWTLAKHIGASPNYISQTLNDNIGVSFFDFVNGYRIDDAQRMLRETDATVLVIAFDVGFNSRSSFYTAFNKVTGQTPSQYRKQMSAPT